MTNNLCYRVGESTSAVSVCAPIYYAHLICKRGGLLLAECANEKRMEKVSSTTNDKTIDKAACGLEAFETRGIHQRYVILIPTGYLIIVLNADLYKGFRIQRSTRDGK